MKKHLVIALCSLLPVLSFAQDATPAPAARPDVDELLNVMRVDKLSQGMIGQMEKMAVNFSKQSAGASGANADKMEAMQKKIFALIESEMAWDKMKGDYAKLYADTFSPEEVKAVTDFYKSPAGQTFLDKQSELAQKAMALSQQKAMAMMPALQALIKSETAPASSPTPAK